MNIGKNVPVQVRIIRARDEPVIKSDHSEQLDKYEALNAGEWINQPYDMQGLRTMVKHSSILPQCIKAYRHNIAGFGIGVRYNTDETETAEMAAEYKRAEEIIELLNIEKDTKEVFEDIVEAREIYGIAYLEVVRNFAGEVVQVEFIRDTPSIKVTEQMGEYIEYSYYHHGQETRRKKRFRKYRQDIGGKTVYFREFGDPRVMDMRSGEYVKSLELKYQANEIMAFPIGSEPYGEVRWIGQTLGVDGSRRAEELNNNYFINGRHTPLMIIVKGGTLTDESFVKLQGYMNDIKGAAGQHAFLVMETAQLEGRVDFNDEKQPEIEIKELANILQHDELFQGYLDNNRRRVQSAFQLPDLYVAYTTDFNRATAQTAQSVTEEQVFQPQRKSLAWTINNRLLNGYQFKYVEVYFKEPDITDTEELCKLLTVVNAAGGITPNKAKEIGYKALGEVSEDYDGEWGDVPIAVSRQNTIDLGNIAMSVNKAIQKARLAGDDDVVPIMKQVRRLLLDIKKNGDLNVVH